MASIASTSASASGTTATAGSTAGNEERPRPQAGPLPSKRGEIGFREDLHGRGRDLESGIVQEEVVPLPPRHPADRDAPPPADSDTPAEGATTDVPLTPGPVQPTASSTTPTETSSTHSAGKRSIISFLKPRKVPSYGGIQLTTFVLFVTQFILVGGTIAGWVLAVKALSKTSKATSASQQQSSNLGANSSSIFVHVVFAIALIVQLLFLERRIFRLRAERYSFLHPGDVLPTSRGRPSSAALAFAPWNRPPLPTYAAALAETGHGTGDVEDNAIAVPPPPAYGNTRNSRLLLSGFMNETLRAQRPISEHSQMSRREDGERPLSYVSQDQQWQEIQDAERARRLEETLGKLEEGSVAPSGTNSNHGPTASTSTAGSAQS